jgi:hypothetical protein
LGRRSVQQSSQAAAFFSRYNNYNCSFEVSYIDHYLRTRVSQIYMCIKCWPFFSNL